MHARGSLSDTIVACATPPGEGAVAIVRLSGALALRICAGLAPRAEARRSHQLYRAVLRDASGQVLDEAMVVEMHPPRSYTGEPVAEMHLHGSRSVVQAVLAACQAAGARLAEPGEFTLRAFLNGRLDLAQAEAVGDLIASSNDAQRAAAAAQLLGGLSRQVEQLVGRLEEVLSSWRAALDFPEHPTGEGLLAGHRVELQAVAEELGRLIAGARVELRVGRQVVLCGAPNVGKSSLVNTWLGEKRVLVDATPGTTRDPIEVPLRQGLAQWSLWDTAGIREQATGLELEGIGMSLERAQRADVALWLVGPDAPVWPPENLRVAVAGSKADLASPSRRAQVEAEAERRGLLFWGWVSAKTGEGTTELMARVRGEVDVPLPADAVVVVRERHLAALQQARDALHRVDAGLSAEATLDVLAWELEGAAKSLAQVLGRDVDLEVLDKIFAQFCIGK